MSNDIISKFTISDNNKILARNVYKLALVLFILVNIYYVLDAIDWFIFVTKDNPLRKYNHHFMYVYRIRPLIAITNLVLAIFSYKNYYTAFKYLAKATEKEDTELFYKANSSFFVAVILGTIAYSISILSISYRLLFVND